MVTMFTSFQNYVPSFVSSMWDSSWPSFDETIPIDISSLSRNQSQKQKLSTLRSVCLNDRFSCSQHRFTSLTFNRKIRLSVQHQIIYSHAGYCTMVLSKSLALMVISIALVNGSHHWPVIKWFLPCQKSRHCNHMDRIVLCGRRDEDPRYLFKALIAFPKIAMEFCIYSMDPHLYGHGYAQICVCMTQIYIVCLVPMSKFESSITWIYAVFQQPCLFIPLMDLPCIGLQPWVWLLVSMSQHTDVLQMPT